MEGITRALKRQFIPLALMLTALVGMAVGCSENKALTPAETAAAEQKTIANIQNDPNLPAAAKENIIRNMQQQKAAAQTKGQASGAGMATAASSGAGKTQ
jgi:hypothetical protein